MEEGYELIEQQLDSQRNLSLLVLKETKVENTFIDDLAANIRKKSMAREIVSVAIRLAERGTAWALECKVLKRLHCDGGTLAIYELKIHRSVYRVMTYLHNDVSRTPVLLFAFSGHTSKKAGGIRKEELKRGQRLAAIAKRLMEEELEETEHDTERKEPRVAS